MKAVWTLNVDNYSPRITDITYPWMQRYARRIGADFNVISERRFPEFPPVYEKLQIHELGRGYEWNIYFDGDALVHPDLFDVTQFVPKDTVLQNSQDMAANRWTYDKYFLRDGRNIGACNWFTVASNWCLDLWKPLDDLSAAEAIARIQVIAFEQQFKIQPEHLIDDYVLSRNIARFGLKHLSMNALIAKLGQPKAEYFWHNYLAPNDVKPGLLEDALLQWKLVEPKPTMELVS